MLSVSEYSALRSRIFKASGSTDLIGERWRQKCEVHCGPGTEFEEIDARASVSPLISPRKQRAFCCSGTGLYRHYGSWRDGQKQGLRGQDALVFSVRSGIRPVVFRQIGRSLCQSF